MEREDWMENGPKFWEHIPSLGRQMPLQAAVLAHIPFDLAGSDDDCVDRINTFAGKLTHEEK